VLQDDLGIGSAGPGSIVDGVGALDNNNGPEDIDPAILKAMDPQGI